MTNSKKVKKTKGAPRTIFNRMMLIMVIGIFLLLFSSSLAAITLGSIIASSWNVEEDNVLVFGAIVLAISVVVGWVLSFAYSAVMAKVSRPYIKALQKIAECDFSVRIKDTPILAGFNIAEQFNNMVEQLASVELLRENFVSDFSHEFKTPIVSIAGFAKLLKDKNLTEEQRNEYLDVIIDESNRLVGLSENVLLLNRLNTQAVVAEEYSLDEQIRQCVLTFSKQGEQGNYVVDLDLQTVTVNTSKKLVHQVIANLISNAIKFTAPGGNVSIKCFEQNGNAVIVVSDTGCGMTEEVKQNIFNKFYQGDKSHTTEGNGLGLAIVKRILEVLNGTVDVESQLGVGSTFTVTLFGTVVSK